MFTKVIALLALVTLVRSNDVIVGLKTDGTKFFDENRQANPALWRQMDNVTIKAPENEVISRVVITDLRPDKDGDVKIVEGGEGQKNVTIELKSPTVFRGYEFHIEAFSAPEGQMPLDNTQQSTTEGLQGDVTKTTEQSSTSNPESNVSTDKNVPAILTKDEEISDNERQGRNAKTDDISTEGTTEVTSTTLKSDVSTTPVTETTESITENHGKQSEHQSTIPPIPLYKSFNLNPAIPLATGKDSSNDKENTNNKEATRHVRDTEGEKSEQSGDKLDLTPTNIRTYVSAAEKEKKENATAASDVKPVEEKSEDNKDGSNVPKGEVIQNRKFTSIIPSTVEHSVKSIVGSDDDKQRNVRDANDRQKMSESLSTTTESGESTTANDNADSSTTSTEECVTTESSEHSDMNSQNSVNRDIEGTTKLPVYMNERQWNQRFNNPRLQSEDASVQIDQKSPGFQANPAVSPDQSSEKDAETMADNYKPTPDHMESKNPKISAIANFKENKN